MKTWVALHRQPAQASIADAYIILYEMLFRRCIHCRLLYYTRSFYTHIWASSNRGSSKCECTCEASFSALTRVLTPYGLSNAMLHKRS